MNKFLKANLFVIFVFAQVSFSGETKTGECNKLIPWSGAENITEYAYYIPPGQTEDLIYYYVGNAINIPDGLSIELDGSQIGQIWYGLEDVDNSVFCQLDANGFMGVEHCRKGPVLWSNLDGENMTNAIKTLTQDFIENEIQTNPKAAEAVIKVFGTTEIANEAGALFAQIKIPADKQHCVVTIKSLTNPNNDGTAGEGILMCPERNCEGRIEIESQRTCSGVNLSINQCEQHWGPITTWTEVTTGETKKGSKQTGSLVSFDRPHTGPQVGVPYEVEVNLGNIGLADECVLNASTTIDFWERLTSSVDKFDAQCVGVNDGEATIQVSGGVPNYEIRWFNHNGDEVATGETVQNLSPGTYTALVHDAVSCPHQNHVAIGTFHQPIAEIIKSDISCHGGSNGSLSIFNVEDLGAPIESVLWSNGQTGNHINNLSSGDYKATIKGTNGCLVTAQEYIEEPDELIIEEPKVTIDYCKRGANGNVEIAATGGTGELSYSISQFNNFSSATQNSSGAFSELINGHYNVVVTDRKSCQVESEFYVQYHQPGEKVYEPNAFSPNGDGINDEFFLNAASNTELKGQLLIFDRWGSTVYASPSGTPINEAKWNGVAQGGKEAAVGVYVWFFKFDQWGIKRCGKDLVKGDVLLSR